MVSPRSISVCSQSNTARSKRDGRFYAIKLLEKRKVIENKKTRVLMNERNILSRVNHSSILKLFECFETHLFFCFVLECKGVVECRLSWWRVVLCT